MLNPLEARRPKYFPPFIGIGSENAAHRIAIEWEEDGVRKEGVYIPRRDTSSYFNHLVGGRLFPGRHHHATFTVNEDDGNYRIAFQSPDGTFISLEAGKAETFDSASIFQKIDNASEFFKSGAVGYSPNNKNYDGLELKTFDWKTEPLNVTSVRSGFFENENVFPKGSIRFDNALLMKKLKHEWHSVGQKSCCNQ